jgi:hypothetical protein
MAEPVLDQPRVMAGIGQGISSALCGLAWAGVVVPADARECA